MSRLIITPLIVERRKEMLSKRILILSAIALPTYAQDSDQVTPPEVQFLDQFQVNVMNGAYSPTVNDISIGGERGLSHSVSTHTNEFVNVHNYAPYGPVDSYHGSVTFSYRSASVGALPTQPVINVSGGGASASFVENSDGTYAPRGEYKGSLDYTSGYGFVYTSPDGAQFHYPSPTNRPGPSSGSKLTKIVQANGAITEIVWGMGSYQPRIEKVSNSYGYSLVYQYSTDNRTMSNSGVNASLAQSYENAYNGGSTAGDALYSLSTSSNSWASNMPSHIAGVNEAYISCSPTCTPGSSWPRSEYWWTAGAPRAFYIGPAEFRVTTSTGASVTFKHEPFDIAHQMSNGSWWRNALPGTNALPRIVETEYSDGRVYQYNYVTANFDFQASSMGSYLKDMDYALIKNAGLMCDESECDSGYYNMYASGPNSSVINARSGYQGVSQIRNSGIGDLIQVITWSKTMWYNAGNVLSWYHDNSTGDDIYFIRDGRDNITEVKRNGLVIWTAQYPNSCTTSNRKYCNKPEYTVDANGNRTDYTYHPESGNVLTTTLPADRLGTRATISNTYQSFTANHGGDLTAATWLLVETVECQSGSYCSQSESLVTNYAYESQNLQLIGQAITADGVTRATCYEYDQYGNQTSSITTNNFASCQ